MTFHQSCCTTGDPDSRKRLWQASEFLGMKKLIHWSLIHRKQTLTRTVKTSLLPECRRLYPSNDFIFMQNSARSHHKKVTQQFLRQNTPDFIAADEWASYSPDLNPVDYCIWDILQDLVYKGRRLPFATRQSKTNRRSPLRQFENPLHNGKISPVRGLTVDF